ncbi:hypothetical protein [Arsenicibacter rosenii]|nr:hypothetical protein [Arsenicibacter rosenii]
MKTSSFARTAVMAVLCIAALTGCKKETEPSPELSARVTGSYTISTIETGGKTYQAGQTNLKGGLTVVRESETSVGIDLNITTKDNGDFLQGNVSDVSLTDAGNGEVNLVKSGDNFGKGGNGRISVKVSDSNDQDMIITLKK